MNFCIFSLIFKIVKITKTCNPITQSSISFCILFNFDLFLNTPTPIIILGTRNNLISQTLSNTLASSHGRFPSTNTHQVKRLTCSSQRRYVYSLSFNGATSSDSLRVFAGSSCFYCFDENAKWVLASMKMNKLEALLHNQTCPQLLSSVPTMEHQSVNQSLHNRTLRLSEFQHLILSCCMGHKHLGLAAFISYMICKNQI